ncbi:YhgE/Pip domain-containing protein [Lysinibacillus sp. SGAir0095]|uniref:YhgE/Pip domain-containing protein n=1 Tax=Lysinibacillus sp. SGAir0095 TaxID=2070463 RepID=UPI0010CD3433|nr:YhgE/Pip domain-containing protein [Lysinibacillus sp. SGAir0095]QCR30782.1 YhgE/Pip domain-containing protein [Lysinibacillus sp. SGAir0095]
MLKAEWLKILKTKKMLIPIIAILFIPVLYSGMFLWAFWDPYANLKNMPVAIENDDKGATYDGEQLALGDSLVEKLMDSNQFKFIEVDADHAEKQLKEQDYYILIKIPENFSEHATTLLDKNPEKLTIEYIPNEGFNFLGAQIGETAMERIKAEVNTQVSKTYAEKLFGSIAKLSGGVTEAADGANKIDDGAKKVTDGVDDLQGYLLQLAESTIELSDGSKTLQEGTESAAIGATKLADGIKQLQNGATPLAEGANTLNAGTVQLKKGITDYTTGVTQVAEGQASITNGGAELASNLQLLAKGTSGLDDNIASLAVGSDGVTAGLEQLSAALKPVLASLPESDKQELEQTLQQLQAGSAQVSSGLGQLKEGTVGIDDNITALSQGATQLNEGNQEINAGIQQLTSNSKALVNGITGLSDGSATLADGIQQLAEGTDSAVTGANELSNGLNKLVGGTNQLTDGTTLLSEKSDELANGATKLVDGSKELVGGTSTLAEKLSDASEQADVKVSDENYDMVAAPVEIEKTSVNHVPNYGSGFAPYFISLGLFVGALLVSIVFPLVEPAIRPTSGFKWFLSKVSVLAVVGIIQAVITGVVVMGALGLEVDNLALFMSTCILTSFTFLALIQLLVSVLGDPGRFIAILILILQLTTSAGTFPLELVPSQLHIFNTFLPMTFSVQAFKAAISTGDTSFLMYNWSILGIYLVVCLALSTCYFALLYKKRHSMQTEVEHA